MNEFTPRNKSTNDLPYLKGKQFKKIPYPRVQKQN